MADNHLTVTRNRKLFLAAIIAALFCILLFVLPVKAEQLTPTIVSSDGYGTEKLTDDDYMTTDFYDPGTTLTITTSQSMHSMYIRWDTIPGKWSLKINGQEYFFGDNDYLHEYVELPVDATELVITADKARLTIADIYVFSEGTLPDFVQKWEPSYEQADVLLISTHADDEILFFGGIIPNYVDRGDVRIQLAYFSDFFQSEPYRNHELLNGLWTMGVDHYPQLGEFYDNYSESLEEAQSQFDHDAGLEYIVRTIRRFKPQVIIGQDPLGGEYGHGGHMFSANLIEEAIDISADATQYTQSAEKYGTWEPLKTYFHLYPENTIELDARVPLSSFGGKTALEVAKLAYLQHQSQQWMWFYVSDGYDEDGNPDGYEYSCTKYGLYKSLVGTDTTNDILENITTYDEQERISAQAAVLAANAEEASEADTQAEEANAETSTVQSVVDNNSTTSIAGGRNTTSLTIFIILAVIVVIIIIAILVISKSKEKLRIQERKLERMRRNEMMRTGSGHRRSGSSAAGRRTTSSGVAAARRNTAQSSYGRGERRSSQIHANTGVRSTYQGRTSQRNANVRRGDMNGYNPRRSSNGFISRIYNDED